MDSNQGKQGIKLNSKVTIEWDAVASLESGDHAVMGMFGKQCKCGFLSLQRKRATEIAAAEKQGTQLHVHKVMFISTMEMHKLHEDCSLDVYKQVDFAPSCVECQRWAQTDLETHLKSVFALSILEGTTEKLATCKNVKSYSETVF